MQNSGSNQSNLPLPLTRPTEPPQASTSHPISVNNEVAEQPLPAAKSLTEYTQSRKTPYAYEFFGIDKTVQKIPSFQNWAVGIDDFVMLEMRDNDLEDSLDTYKNILSEIASSLNLHENTIGSKKLEKMYRWINEVLRPQRELARKRKEIIGI